MKKICMYCVTLIFALHIQNEGQGQFLKKLKEKVNQITNNNNSSNSQNNSSNTSSQNNNGPVNKTGAGITNTPPPDIPLNMDNAQKAMQGSNYSQARYALEQAIQGVEIKLGKQILQSLPTTVDGLTRDDSKSVVTSNQFGWSNMTMQTVYGDGKDKQMTVSIGTLPLYAGLVNMYFMNNTTYVQENGQQNPNIKQTQVKGEKAIIQFDQSKGYTLIAELGQSTVMVWECVNFATEDEVMSAANSFDLDSIKKQMGEQ
jgi:hypothetical protein